MDKIFFLKKTTSLISDVVGKAPPVKSRIAPPPKKASSPVEPRSYDAPAPANKISNFLVLSTTPAPPGLRGFHFWLWTSPNYQVPWFIVKLGILIYSPSAIKELGANEINMP